MARARGVGVELLINHEVKPSVLSRNENVCVCCVCLCCDVIKMAAEKHVVVVHLLSGISRSIRTSFATWWITQPD